METDQIKLEITRKQKSLWISVGASFAFLLGVVGDLPILRETYFSVGGVALITGSIGLNFLLLIFNSVLGASTLLGSKDKNYLGSKRFPLGFNFLGLAWVNILYLYLRFVVVDMPIWYHAGIILSGITILVLSRIFIPKSTREELFP